MLPTDDEQQRFQTLTAETGFASSLVKSLRILEIDDVPDEDERGRRRVEGWRMSFEGVISQDMTNLFGNLHGAAVSWLVDTLTSVALVQLHTPTFWGPPMMAGVSLSMEIQYLNPGRLGNKILIEVEILKCTLTLANLRCEIKDMKSKRLIAAGTHLRTWKPSELARL
nr:hypothetical protein L203_04344 [Cryptococcus depauperatus CBS 7841]